MIVQETLAIGEARPGMRLAAAIEDDTGRVLVPAGAELTESMLLSLGRRDIAELAIEREVEEDPAALEARRARIEQQLDQLFRLAGDGLESRILRQAIFEFHREHGA